MGMIQPMGEVDEARMAPRHVIDEAERKLLCAVIGQARMDLRRPSERSSARAFFHSQHFAEMCAYLDLSPERLRLSALG